MSLNSTVVSFTAVASSSVSSGVAIGDAESGSRIALYVNATSPAVKVVPSWNRTPSRILTVTVSPSALRAGIARARSGSAVRSFA